MFSSPHCKSALWPTQPNRIGTGGFFCDGESASACTCPHQHLVRSVRMSHASTPAHLIRASWLSTGTDLLSRNICFEIEHKMAGFTCYKLWKCYLKNTDLLRQTVGLRDTCEAACPHLSRLSACTYITALCLEWMCNLRVAYRNRFASSSVAYYGCVPSRVVWTVVSCS
jgi:hypothetical protein